MAKKKVELKLRIIEVIRKKNISLATKRKAMKEVRAMAAHKSCSFQDSGCLGTCFLWNKSPSGHKFWEDIDRTKDKTA